MIFLAALCGLSWHTAFAQGMGGAGADTITQLTENVYRRGPTSNTFLVTDEGIIMVDATCSGGGMEWLKEELDRRFGVPVKYVILSHDHEMHICGLQVFDDTAVTIGHRNIREHLIRENRNTSIPDVVFEDEMEIFLGGQRAVLYYFGKTHSDNLIQVHFPEEGVLIAPDIARAERSLALPDFRDADIDGLIDTLAILAKLDDVELVVPGHWGPTTQQSLLEYRDYVIALRDRVLEEMKVGASIEEILERVTLDEYADYGNFDIWFRANLISMWDKMYRYREPNLEDSGDYQTAYPIGFSVGVTGMGSNQ